MLQKFSKLVEIMARLRAPDGCPWDREQTHASILSCLVEEAHEFVDAVERSDIPNMREELGDLLLQVVFHAQMAQEAGTFTLEEVIEGISEKLIRRHPHVFGEAEASGSEAVMVQWDEIKRREKEALRAEGGGVAPDGPESALDGIPRSLGALLKAAKLQKKAGRIGFDWPDWRGTLEKLREEMEEVAVEAAHPERNAEALEEEVGDLLFSAVNVSRALKIDPEQALGKANVKFRRRFQAMEAGLRGDGLNPEEAGLEVLESYWQRAKAAEKAG